MFESPRHPGWNMLFLHLQKQSSHREAYSPPVGSSLGRKFISHLSQRTERLCHVGVPLNCHGVSAPEGIGQSMKTLISEICIRGKKIPNLSHLQTFHLERWLLPAWNSCCITNTTLSLSTSPARKTGMFSNMLELGLRCLSECSHYSC